jgi:hypothetical protein
MCPSMQTGVKEIQVSMYNELEQRSCRCPCTTNWSKGHAGVHVQQTGATIIQVSIYANWSKGHAGVHAQ